MDKLFSLIRSLATRRWARWAAGLGAMGAVVATVMSASTPPAIPAVYLAAEPLYAKGARAKPTLTLALSVEFPTVGAQYLDGVPGDNVDNTYSPTVQYLGYFDTESCYTYNDTPTEAPTSAQIPNYKRFDRLSTPATNRTCGGAGFSGNFMNWATSSAIDILRYGLTGGDRVVDTATLTVLQRAVLPNSNVSNNFWNGSNFPSKQISNAVAAGALPSALLGSYTGTVYVANCLNRVHFGTAATGSCANPGANTGLGTAAPANATGPITSVNTALPTGFTYCAGENGSCTFTGVQQVAYGADVGTTHHWYYMSASNGVSCSNGVFGDPYSGTVKACYIRNDPTGWTPPTNASALTADTFFYTRVSVCGTDASGNLLDPRSSLCLRYPNGNYKPTGNLQKYSDRIRVAAFGYLNDATGDPNQRYGGVLRAPMKYVGASTYDANFSLVSGTNPNQEWDPSTGVFFANPDGNSTIGSGPSYTGPYLSGVTNYLNQFGRTGILGQYKTFDPVGELYYESVRYLQGLPPTAAAVTGVDPVGNPGLQDGYPVFTTWTDPHPAVAGMTDYSCVNNNVVAIGDIHTWNDKSIPGNVTNGSNEGSTSTIGFPFPPGRPANASGNEPDFYQWTKVIGGFESGTTVSYVDGKGNTQSTTSPTNPNPNTARWGMENQSIGAEGASYLMAGVAYWANTHDIRGAGWTTNWPSASDPRRPGMRIKTYVIDVNENGDSSPAGHRHNNQFFMASKYGGFKDASLTGNPFLTASGGNNDNDWQDPSNPGEANNYFLSSSSASVLAALNQIFARVASQADSIAGGAISTQRLTASNGFVYQAQFDASSWAGDLLADQVTVDASGNATISTTPAWTAATTLAATAATARNIVVGKTTATSTAAATDFNWSALDADAQAALQAPPYAASGASADPVATGQARLTYLRGDISNEAPSGLLFRKRTRLNSGLGAMMGDVVNSPVLYMGAPSNQISDSSYASFYSTNKTRKHALFVGANDGMMHAFDPDNSGAELFAYIPSWLVPSLGRLTSTSYIHQSYADGSAAVAEAQLGTSGTWKTVLVSGTGAGGQGVFALDVSDPAAFDATKVLWEFKDSDDADLGNVVGRPQILKLRTSALSAAAVYKYFAVFASGVNNYANDGHYSATGNPALFFLDLSKAKGTAWTLGTNYFKVSFPAANTTTATGMVGFSVRPGVANEVAAIYAGDLQGDLWKLDFSKAANGTSDWSLAKLSYFVDSSSAPMPMFVAKDASGNRQPITMEPSLVFGANRSLIVTFGTGKYMEVGDNSPPYPQQTVYAVLDNGSATPDSGSGSTAAVAGRARLAASTWNSSTGVITVPSFNWGRSLSDTDASGTRSGWYLDYGTAGERQISDFTVLLGTAFFGSVIPAQSSCDNGSGNLYSVVIATGVGSSQASTVGMLAQPLLAQIGSSTLTNTDTTGRLTETTRYQIIVQGPGGTMTDPVTLGRTVQQIQGRLSWREISNFQQLRQ